MKRPVRSSSPRDATRAFHREWLGLAQPIEGLVFSVPALDEAQAPAARPEITTALRAHIARSTDGELEPVLRSTEELFRSFLGYERRGALVLRSELPPDISFYAPESRQEIRPSFAIARGPLPDDDADPFAEFHTQPVHGVAGSNPAAPIDRSTPSGRYIALVWDLGDDVPAGTDGTTLELDRPEDATGAWHYPPTAKLERLLRHLAVPIGFVSNRRHLRLVYAPAGEATSHLTFRFEDLADPAGRPLALALELLFSARRTYAADPKHTFEGLLAESRRRQADVTGELAEQVFSAIERLLEGFEAAARRDANPDRPDSLRAAMEAGHVYEGVLNLVLRLVFLLYAEDRSLLPVGHPTYAAHLSVLGLYERLAHDAGAHPESMHQRFGAYGALVSLFRAVYFGVRHALPDGELRLPPRQGRLFDPSAFPFLEGGLPGDTAAVALPEDRAQVRLPTVDDGTLYEVLHALIVLDGQRLSYRDLSVEQIGAVYESLMGYTVHRVEGPAVRLGKLGYWLEIRALRAATKLERTRLLTERCDLSKKALDKASEILARAEGSESSDDAVSDALLELAGKKSERQRHEAQDGQLVLQPTASRRSTGSHYTPRSLSEKVVRRTLEPILACLSSPSASASPSPLSVPVPVPVPASPLSSSSDHPLPEGGGRGVGADGGGGSPSALLSSPSDHPLPEGGGRGVGADGGGGRGVGPTADQILQLKVCDPAMGSGAFLVEACRFLGAAVVEAWRRSGELPRMIELHGDAELHAKRLVAQRCLYGVDKNAAAVELAKLSLWLETLSGELPFTFLDHVLRHGDSLVGLDLNQVRAFHWSPDAQLPTVAGLVSAALAEVKEHRDAIQRLSDDESDAAQRDKRRLNELASHAMERVKLVADVCVGAFFAHPKPKDREKERDQRLAVVEAYLSGDESQEPTLRAWAETIRAQHAPFHWHLELPEVFFLERPDPLDGGKTNGAAFMDAFVGNPPFAGKNNISETNGEGYLDWLQTLHEGAHGNADLSAHFFRRAAHLTGNHGTIGLISTNTIAQGDTRATGLQHLVGRGFTIYDATRSMMWPGAAAVSVSLIHLARGAPVRHLKTRLLGDRQVEAISSRLRGTPDRPDPQPLRSNADLSFVGSIPLPPEGFIVERSELPDLIPEGVADGSLPVFPYRGGFETNNSPSLECAQLIINFGQLTESEAAEWPRLLKRVRDRVYALRQSNKRKNYRDFWWQYAEYRPGLYAALGSGRECTITSLTARHRSFAVVPSKAVFDQSLVVFPIQVRSFFAVAQSRVHLEWELLLAATMKEDLRYISSDCFETFPFPQPDPRTVLPDLEDIGQRLYDERAAYMVDTQQGLTQTYNQLKDPSCQEPRILHLRQLHEEMDRAVLRAYGWPDIEVPPFCPLTPADQKALETFQDQVIDRLFLLNASRAQEEARQGTATKAAAKKPPKPKAPKKPTPTPPPDQGTLF